MLNELLLRAAGLLEEISYSSLMCSIRLSLLAKAMAVELYEAAAALPTTDSNKQEAAPPSAKKPIGGGHIYVRYERYGGYAGGGS
jgi:hypothetical protein